ncbi:hypothetical protein GA0061081_11413 [Gilliamella bombicola]|uniref:Uncharacterized protein n=1 Tax=Gilliamella bombicola TaxID=1798182 RepID=A0A1C4D7B5_9GAMM|nr:MULTISPECIES: hypothetical protein [Gilliamella]NUF28492.1 hypothetical protein [Gilliamella sp. ESL0254]SCC27227.1 hypothetical protein GA0061081_11413 [Gilliamella bombicola]
MKLKKLKISHIIYVLLVFAILYYPVKITKYYLMDLSYDEILDFGWRGDGCKTKDGNWVDSIDCPCGRGLMESDDPYNKISDEGYFYYNDELLGKVTLKRKPSYFSGDEILTGGELEIEHLETGIICYYDSILD